MEPVTASPRRPIRVLLVDDQILIRMGFRMVLDAQDGIEVVGEAADGRMGIEMCRTFAPDVVLMDVRMPGMDGIGATSTIVEECPRSRVIVFTTFDLDEYAFAALRAGASGFLLKDVGPAELLASIRAVAGGDAAISSRVSRRMLDLFSQRLPAGPPAGGDEAVASLTPREREILSAIAGGLTNTEIGERMFVAESTVKTHVGRILMKLGLRDRVHAVIFAYEHGLNGRRPHHDWGKRAGA
ncbi:MULTISPECIES: response regulator transcription factor [unclassified Arthrobacter]|uniref:response regulator transcription factor n=1 Tax=unclassified Arthrobacter TaxID=235627 RepID=UPI002E0A4357|nr:MULTISPECIES: response regulator transcription factor [unclassified Arthrobacter]MEC5193022.1 DNA-binding NarL/FixJ family response regulator [Arthrobacter sp. MP_M4]MEC5204552.1 DNA-binding NarL/FixJ family response regulator [Arthrobacter sp. MP_M7]